jgi:hypothetical protein
VRPASSVGKDMIGGKSLFSYLATIEMASSRRLAKYL